MAEFILISCKNDTRQSVNNKRIFAFKWKASKSVWARRCNMGPFDQCFQSIQGVGHAAISQNVIDILTRCAKNQVSVNFKFMRIRCTI